MTFDFPENYSLSEARRDGGKVAIMIEDLFDDLIEVPNEEKATVCQQITEYLDELEDFSRYNPKTYEMYKAFYVSLIENWDIEVAKKLIPD